MPSRGETVEVSTTITGDDGEDLDVLVTCRVTPGEPPQGPTYDCGGYPGSSPEVEILAIEKDEPGAITSDVSFLIDGLSKEERERIEEKALGDAAEQERGAYDDAMEARWEARMDR